MDNKIANFLFTKVGMPKFENFLNLSSLKHKLTAGNIANASSPGYRSQNIDFTEELNKASDNSRHIAGSITNASHIPLGHNANKSPEINQASINEGDMNSVDIDNEIAEMAQNELEFTIAAKLLQKKFQVLRKAITSK
ncbi:MAG: flagellar basal body rod protein FlgB [bacterium]